MHHRGVLLVVAISASLFFSTVGANCYYPNGTDKNGPDGSPQSSIPCDRKSDVSMCCLTIDKCDRTSGLCHDASGTLLWRESCTDPTWKSPTCIKLFVNGTAIGQPTFGQYNNQMADNDIAVTTCADGSFCCGMGSTGKSCCESGSGVFVLNGDSTSKNPNATSTSSSSSSSATSASSSSAAAAAGTPVPAPVSHTGPIAGGVVGGIVGLAIVGAAMAWFLIRRKRTSSRQGDDLKSNRVELEQNHGVEKKSKPSLHEVPGNLYAGGKGRPELDGRVAPVTQSELE